MRAPSILSAEGVPLRVYVNVVRWVRTIHLIHDETFYTEEGLDWERERITLIKGHRRSENDVRNLRAEIGSLPLANNAQHSPTSIYMSILHRRFSTSVLDICKTAVFVVSHRTPSNLGRVCE